MNFCFDYYLYKNRKGSVGNTGVTTPRIDSIQPTEDVCTDNTVPADTEGWQLVQKKKKPFTANTKISNVCALANSSNTQLYNTIQSKSKTDSLK